MNFIRSSLHMLVLIVTVIPCALLVLLASLFISKKNLWRLGSAWLRLAVNSGSLILGIKNRITGMEYLPQDPRAGAVFLVKHQSTWETFVMAAILRRQLAFVFKRELLRIPFFGWTMARHDMIFIDRGQRSQAMHKLLSEGKRLLGEGVWIVMFPEGTRIPRGQTGKFSSGGARLAIEAGAPIIPVAVTSAKCWPPKAFVKKPGIVDICIGPPIDSTNRKARELTAEAQNWIEAQMKRLDPEAYA